MRAAIHALRQRGVGRIVVAVPTVALQTAVQLQSEVDEWVAALTPTHFWGVARWYYDFSQTTDQEVIDLLAQAARNGHTTHAAHAAAWPEPTPHPAGRTTAAQTGAAARPL